MNSVHRQYLLIFLTAVLLALSLLKPGFPVDQSLQHIPTIPAMGLMALAARRRCWTMGALCCVLAFTVLHILGARYVYSLVPYDEWCRRLLDWSPQEAFGWQRNHYDRLVHFLFGMLMVVPIGQLIRGPDCRWTVSLLAVCFCCISTAGAIYEVVEWGVALVMSPQHADRYNGQQGDLFDAQKDTALAMLGAVMTSTLLVAVRRRPRNNSAKLKY